MIIKTSLSLAMACIVGAPTIADAAYEWSEFEFARNYQRSDNTMRVISNGRTSLRSWRFVGRVGGVNFESVVDLGGYDIDLDYDPRRDDGERATMTLNGAHYTIPLYDWELKPIADFADTEYTAVVSIFGEGPDPENFRYIDYHPAFEDTHLGARLLQADILLMHPFIFSEVPTQNDRKIYMPGEARELSEEQRFPLALEVAAMTGGEEYQAWVLTDIELEPRIVLSKNEITVSLSPYYFFWITESSAGDALIDDYNSLVDQAQKLVPLYEKTYDRYLQAPVDSDSEAQAFEQLQALEAQLNPILTQLAELQSRIDSIEPEVLEVTSLTQRFRESSDAVRELAPFVYDAVDTTAQFAALFRGAKKVDGVDWQAFRAEISREIDLPLSETPNQISR